MLDCSGGLADRLAAVRGCMEAVAGAEAAAVGEEGSDFISRPQVTHPHAPPLLLCGCCSYACRRCLCRDGRCPSTLLASLLPWF